MHCLGPVMYIYIYTYLCIYTYIHICAYVYIVDHETWMQGRLFEDSYSLMLQYTRGTANLTWGDIFEISKLKARTSLLPRFSEKRGSSFELWALKQHSKMSPQVGLAVTPILQHPAIHRNTPQRIVHWWSTYQMPLLRKRMSPVRRHSCTRTTATQTLQHTYCNIYATPYCNTFLSCTHLISDDILQTAICTVKQNCRAAVFWEFLLDAHVAQTHLACLHTLVHTHHCNTHTATHILQHPYYDTLQHTASYSTPMLRRRIWPACKLSCRHTISNDNHQKSAVQWFDMLMISGSWVLKMSAWCIRNVNLYMFGCGCMYVYVYRYTYIYINILHVWVWVYVCIRI